MLFVGVRPINPGDDQLQWSVFNSVPTVLLEVNYDMIDKEVDRMEDRHYVFLDLNRRKDVRVSDKLTEVRKELKDARSNLSRLEKDTKNYGKATRSLWMKIERELKEGFNVYWSVYHGGALEGVQARAFVRHIVDIMKMIKALCMAFLDSLSQNEQNERADERELDLYFGGFQRLF